MRHGGCDISGCARQIQAESKFPPPSSAVRAMRAKLNSAVRHAQENARAMRNRSPESLREHYGIATVFSPNVASAHGGTCGAVSLILKLQPATASMTSGGLRTADVSEGRSRFCYYNASVLTYLLRRPENWTEILSVDGPP